MSSFFSAAFDEVCLKAENAEETFVSLYERTCKYGGPEEGGWWRHDLILVKSAKYPTKSLAGQVALAVAVRAEKMSAESRRAYGERCSREVDWCDERGLDADYLPEPDGPSEFEIVIEKVAGSRSFRSSAVYE
jgi:hypothetical protein